MKPKTLKAYYERARKQGWALPQFNVSTAEQMKGVVEAAVAEKAPLLFGTSEGDSGFLGKAQAVALVEAWRKETKLPIFLNFDHGKSLESITEAIEAGYDAVHFDGSRLGFAENIAATKKVVALAKKHRISVVEGEFEEVPGHHSLLHRGKMEISNFELTDPARAAQFVRKTGVDSLAIMIGTVHGIYSKGNPKLNLKRLQEIRKRVTSYLVLHGGSGTPPKDLLYAVKTGVVKVNISTELRTAFVQGLKQALRDHPQEITPYKIFPLSVERVRKAAAKKMQFLGSSGKAQQ